MKNRMEEVDIFEQRAEELRAKTAQAEKELVTYCRNAMLSCAKEFFEKHPDVESVFWTQYTPHFNDGEPCEFNVYSMQLILKGDEDACEHEGSLLYTLSDISRFEELLEEAELYEKDSDKWRHEYANRWYTKPIYMKERCVERLNEAKTFVEKYGDVESDLRKLEDIRDAIGEYTLKNIYGDHVKITFDSTGYKIEEHDHD